MDWLDDDGFMTERSRKYGPRSSEGARSVEDLAREDPGYLYRILGLGDTGSEDAEGIRTALRFAGHDPDEAA